MIKNIKRLSIILIIALVLCLNAIAFANGIEDGKPPKGSVSIGKDIVALVGNLKGTKYRNVVLTINAEDEESDINRVAIMDGTTTTINWLDWNDNTLFSDTDNPNVKEKAWTLTQGDGLKTIDIIVEDIYGNVTPSEYDEDYTITYDMKGGVGGPENATKELGVPYLIPDEVPTREGYTFKGWSVSSETTVVDYHPLDYYTKNENLILYAVWQLQTYTYTFVIGEGATGGPTSPLQVQALVELDPQEDWGWPTKEGYKFEGWALEPNSTSIHIGANSHSHTPVSDKTLYAVWKQKDRVKILYNANGGAQSYEEYKYKGEPYTIFNTVPTKWDGAQFLGWSLVPGDEASTHIDYRAGDVYEGDTQLNLYAAWELLYVEVTLNPNGGSLGTITSPIRTRKGQNTVMPVEEPTREGYTFLGWAASPTATTGTYGPNEEASIGSDTTLYAIWEPTFAQYVKGLQFNVAVKRLAGHNYGLNDYDEIDENITRFAWSEVPPANYSSAIKVSDNISSITTGSVANLSADGAPIYAWYESGTIYINSPADSITLYDSCDNMFYNFRNVASFNLTNDLHLTEETTNVTNMSQMFYGFGYNSLTNFELGEMFNSINVTDMWGMFNSLGYKEIQELDLGDKFDTQNCTSMGVMFYRCGYTKMTRLDLGDKFDTSKVTLMSSMFSECGYKKMASLDLGDKFDTKNVTSTNSMFANCGHDLMTTLDLGSKFNTSKVTNTGYMFNGCSNLRRIYATTSFVTNLVEYGGNMFYGCSNLAGGNGTTFNYSHTDEEYAHIDGYDGLPGYFWCHDEYTISFNANAGTDTVTGMPTGNKIKLYGVALAIPETPTREGYTFKGWSTSSSATDPTYAAGGAYTTNAATTLYAVWSPEYAQLLKGTEFNGTIKSMLNPGYSCDYSTQDTSISRIEWQSKNGFNISSIPNSARNVSCAGAPIYVWIDSDTSTVKLYSEADHIKLHEDCSNMFTNFRGISYINLGSVDTSEVTNMERMFYDVGYHNTNSIEINVTGWDTSNVTNMKELFYYAAFDSSNINIVGLSTWNTSNVTDMTRTFSYLGTERNCTWNIGNLSGWNTANVTSMREMFSYAAMSADKFDIGNISNWNTSKVTDMHGMFSYVGYYRASVFELDLSNWNTANVTDMGGMFGGCAKLKTIYASSRFTVSPTTETSYMFSNCSRLVGQNGTTYSFEHNNGEYARIDTPSTPGYFTAKS